MHARVVLTDRSSLVLEPVTSQQVDQWASTRLIDHTDAAGARRIIPFTGIFGITVAAE